VDYKKKWNQLPSSYCTCLQVNCVHFKTDMVYAYFILNMVYAYFVLNIKTVSKPMNP